MRNLESTIQTNNEDKQKQKVNINKINTTVIHIINTHAYALDSNNNKFYSLWDTFWFILSMFVFCSFNLITENLYQKLAPIRSENMFKCSFCYYNLLFFCRIVIISDRNLICILLLLTVFIFTVHCMLLFFRRKNCSWINRVHLHYKQLAMKTSILLRIQVELPWLGFYLHSYFS